MTIRNIRTGMMAYMGLSEELARTAEAEAIRAITEEPILRPYANVASVQGIRRNCYDHSPVQVTHIHRAKRMLTVRFMYSF